jgi:hypothetical protein
MVAGTATVSHLAFLAIVVLSILLLIATARGLGVLYALWLGFSSSSYPWWVTIPAVTFVVVASAYVIREAIIRERWRRTR